MGTLLGAAGAASGAGAGAASAATTGAVGSAAAGAAEGAAAGGAGALGSAASGGFASSLSSLLQSQSVGQALDSTGLADVLGATKGSSGLSDLIRSIPVDNQMAMKSNKYDPSSSLMNMGSSFF